MSTDATGAEMLDDMAVFQLKNETKWFQKKNTTSRITRHLVAVLKTFHSDFLVLKNRGADLETSYSLNVFY